MPKINLADPWTYRTPLLTVTYPAGEHEVSDEIAAAAPAQPEEEQDDGNGPAKISPPRRSRKAQG